MASTCPSLRLTMPASPIAPPRTTVPPSMQPPPPSRTAPRAFFSVLSAASERGLRTGHAPDHGLEEKQKLRERERERERLGSAPQPHACRYSLRLFVASHLALDLFASNSPTPRPAWTYARTQSLHTWTACRLPRSASVYVHPTWASDQHGRDRTCHGDDRRRGGVARACQVRAGRGRCGDHCRCRRCRCCCCCRCCYCCCWCDGRGQGGHRRR
jgi:hypothetical protein